MRVHTQVLLVALLGAASLSAAAQDADAMRDISQVWRTVKGGYLYAIPDEELRKAAIRGLLAMDPHAAYMDDAEYTQMTKGTASSFAGIGTEVVKKDGKLVVVAAIDGSPAAAAGLRPLDAIVKINGENAAPKSLPEAVNLIRGPVGSEVKLTIQRGAEPPREVRITRQAIRIEPVSSHLVGSNVAYVRIRSFQAATPEAFAQQLADLMKKQPRALLIDLRANPGGLLDGAASIASLFLPEGTLIVKTDARVAEWKRDYRVETARLRKFAGDDLIAWSRSVPLAVLVDRGTGAGAEMLAAALKENKRATLVGQDTFGKGDIQNLQPLGAGKGAIRFTIATLVTPSGKPIEALGVEPSISVEAVPEPGEFGGDKDPAVQRATQALLR